MFGQGFLGAASPRGADLNLLVEVALGLVLLVGMTLARSGHIRAHAVCQASALILTAVMAITWMIPALGTIFAPGLGRGLGVRPNGIVVAHATVGTLTLGLGAWVVMVAGTSLVPKRFRFTRNKLWMRTLLALWWTTIGLGVLTYALAW